MVVNGVSVRWGGGDGVGGFHSMMHIKAVSRPPVAALGGLPIDIQFVIDVLLAYVTKKENSTS